MDKMKENRDRTFGITLIIIILIVLLSGCMGTYYLSDSEYSDAREEGASITYYDNQIYSGWSNGYYYYYGIPHFYPWNYYYNICPPSHYTHTTHIVITRPVNRPTHRPNRPNRNITVKPNRNIKTNTTIKVKTNRTNNKVTVKPNRNRTNNKVINRRRPK
tara:strand:+ start:189 stop:668 length:480 start_codon:yes stop_codon:yes gene_type:complete